MLMGDFNYRYTSWPPCTDGNAASHEAEPNYQQMFDYSKADVVAMKRELQAINWQKRFSKMTVEECRVDFKI